MAGSPFGARVASGARRLNRHPKLLFAARFVRELLPGDSRFGDPLRPAGRRLAKSRAGGSPP
jgi:hypothetical protein